MITEETIALSTIESNLSGFSSLVKLEFKMEKLEYSKIHIDLSTATWLDANMCAPLGAIAYKASRGNNQINFVNIPANIQKILQKNGFLSHYGHAKRSDDWGTTIQYNRFERKDDRAFAYYIEKHFKTKTIPDMSTSLSKKFWESIFELFSNAVIHSETNLGIFTCGQYFPAKNRLDFTIADLGIGFRANLIKKRGLTYSAEDAISWAMEGQNTTKTGRIPGGHGLKLLSEFIRLNQGRIQVISDTGYWELASDGSICKKKLAYPFQGTIVNVEINTADKRSYVLSTELSKDIF